MKTVKKIFKNYCERKQYHFTIQKKIFENGRIVYTPMVRYPGIFTSWQQIVRVIGYIDVFTMDIQGEQNLTYDECLTHIALFKQKLLSNSTSKIVYEEI